MTDVGEQPNPEIEPAEPPPGGVDAVAEEEPEVPPVVPDLSARHNPRVAIPDAVGDGDGEEGGSEDTGDLKPEREA